MTDSTTDNTGTLKTSGYAYLAGDISLAVANMLNGSPKAAAGAMFWALGGGVLARYGNPKAEKRLELLNGDLIHYLKEQHVEIPKGTDLSKEALKQSGIVEHVERFFYEYPSQVLNALYAVGGVQILRSGFEKTNHWDKATGALVTAGALIGLLVPENKKDEGAPAKKSGGILDWIKEKPLRVSGALYMATNPMLAASALKDYREKPQSMSYAFKLLTAASYVIGNTMLINSSKHNLDASGKAEMQNANEIARVAAQVIAAQPPETQQALIQQMAGYMSTRPGIHVTAEQLATGMQQKLQELASPAALAGFANARKTAHFEAGPAL